MKQITITLSDELVNLITVAMETRDGKSFEQVTLQALTLGIKNLNYRTERNREQYAQFKAWKQEQK